MICPLVLTFVFVLHLHSLQLLHFSPPLPRNSLQLVLHLTQLVKPVCVTLIYAALIIFGLLGNTLTLLVVWLRPNMRSSTYLYLSNMAVSDLLFLLLLPLDIYEFWIDWKLGVFTCKLTVFLAECCMFCTILHITFLSLERYLVVCWPITSKTLVTHRRTRALIGCLWLGAAVSAAPVSVIVGVEDVKKVDHMGREVEYTMCTTSKSSFYSGLVFAMNILYNLYVLVPLCTLGLVYILIGRTLRLRPQSSRKDKSHRHAVRMLGVIFLAFVLCWLPLIVTLTMTYVSQRDGSTSTYNNTHTDSTNNYILTETHFRFYVFAWFFCRLSAAINPLVYHLMSARYRHAVRSLVHTYCLTPSHRLSKTLSSGYSITTL